LKISNSQVEGFISGICADSNIKCFLLYGPDHGLVRERAKKIICNLVNDPKDPFRVIPFSADYLSKNPSHLGDALRSESLLGGLKVIWIKEGNDKILDAVNYILNERFENIVVIEAGDLGPKSKLRKECDTANIAATLGCYLDDTTKLSYLAKQQLNEYGITISPNALSYFVNFLGSDRGRSRSEIEKLALYKQTGEITTHDIEAIIDDSSTISIDQSVFAIFSGDIETGLKITEQIYSDPGALINIIRNAQKHARRLFFIQSRLAKGENIKQTINSLKPPVFFKFRERLIDQAQTWPNTKIYYLIEKLIEAEIAMKSTGYPSKAICERILLKIAAYKAQIKQY
tara:strand:+ start:2297 stop:3328 length:1032 start_codon:yes stop_codon:yes gene_type:complete